MTISSVVQFGPALVALIGLSLPAHAMGKRPVDPNPNPSVSPTPSSIFYVVPAERSNCPAPNPSAKDLFDAISTGRADRVSQILGSELIAIDAMNENCERPLAAAIRSKNESVFSTLRTHYEKFRPLNYKDTMENGYSYEQYAFKYGSLALAQTVEKLSPLKTQEELDTALFVAVESNTTDVINDLLGRGANVKLSVEETNDNLLMSALKFNRGFDVIQLLMSKGFDVTVADVNGDTALLAAARSDSADQTRIVAALVAAGADVNQISSRGDTALNSLSVSNSPEVVKTAQFLIRQGAKVNSGSPGYSALESASQNERIALVTVLINAGAEVKNTQALADAMCARDFTKTPNQDDVFKIARLLLAAGADPNDGSLACAAHFGSYGDSPTAGASIALLKLLIASGANVNSGAILDAAASSGYAGTEAVKILIQAGAEVNFKTGDGVTALMEAAETGSVETIQVLIASGALLDAKDSYGQTAYDLAKSRSRPKAIRDLLKPNSD